MERHVFFVIDPSTERLILIVVPHLLERLKVIKAEKFFGRGHARTNVTIGAQKNISPTDEAIFMRFIACRILARHRFAIPSMLIAPITDVFIVLIGLNW